MSYQCPYCEGDLERGTHVPTLFVCKKCKIGLDEDLLRNDPRYIHKSRNPLA